MSCRTSRAILRTAAVIAICSACSAPAARPAASIRHSSVPATSAAATTTTSPSSPATGADTPSSSPGAVTRPAGPAPTEAAAPTHAAPARTTAVPAPTKTTRAFKNSDVNLAAVFSPAQNDGEGRFLISITVSIGIPIPLLTNYPSVTVCAAGAPTVTFAYAGADGVWHTVTITGGVAGDCVGVGQYKTLAPQPADDENSSGTTLQTKLLSVSLRMTGPNGAWTATS